MRFLNWVRNAIASLGESAEERAVRKDLKKLEGLLVNALEAGTGGISLEDVEENIKRGEELRKNGNVQSVKFEENKKADGKLATARASIKSSTGIRFSLPINDYPYNMQPSLKNILMRLTLKLKRWSAIIGKMVKLALSGII